ncbi:MAG: hypothetical protein K6T88_22330, partial [Bacillus sp. (in: Bacteria)]|nr:hypothetical protein [Bacillus sp. (in: firmicutes)]
MNFWREAEWSEMLFSYLATGWYDWTVSEHLYKNNTHCWSVTSGYYSHYILSAALLQLYRPEDRRLLHQVKEISISHSRLCSFLKGNDFNDLRNSFVQYINGISKVDNDDFVEQLTQIGNALFNAKKARESHTYHVLVVSHQTLSNVTSRNGDTINVSKTVEKANGYILELSSIINKFVIDLVLKVINSLDEPIRHYHLKHFKEEIDDFFSLVEKENVSMIPDDLIKSLTFVTGVVERELDEQKCKNYKLFKQNISSFNEKWKSYNQLSSNLRQLETTLKVLK